MGASPKPPRAWAEKVDGTRITFRWPCGAKQTKDFSKGPPAKRMGAPGAAMMARYWSKDRGGVTAPCPRGPGCPNHKADAT